jgi:hypothetical protein
MGEAPHYSEESLAVSSLEHSTELVVVMIQLAHKRPSYLHYDGRQWVSTTA